MPQRRIAISLPATGTEELEAVRGPLETGWLTQGPKVAEFERLFANYHGVEHALATTSCTTALHLMLVAAGIGPGDEVILPSFTWVATANVVLHCGATPVLADVDPLTYNIDIDDAVSRVTPRTKAVIAVHLFGLMADMSRLRAELPPEVLIFEDAACAAGASADGVSAGSAGHAAAFSFHPRKSITTGEGGMLTTDDDGLATIAGQLRNHGASISEEQRHASPRPYDLPSFNLLGFNYRMTDLQGAVGVAQMAKLGSFIEERQKWADYYRQELSPIDWLQLPIEPADGQHAWQSYVVRFRESAPIERNAAMERLETAGVSTRPGTHAIHMLGYYKDRYGFAAQDLPGARTCAETTMSIPLHNRMSAEDFEYVVENFRKLQG